VGLGRPSQSKLGDQDARRTRDDWLVFCTCRTTPAVQMVEMAIHGVRQTTLDNEAADYRAPSHGTLHTCCFCRAFAEKARQKTERRRGLRPPDARACVLSSLLGDAFSLLKDHRIPFSLHFLRATVVTSSLEHNPSSAYQLLVISSQHFPNPKSTTFFIITR